MVGYGFVTAMALVGAKLNSDQSSRAARSGHAIGRVGLVIMPVGVVLFVVGLALV